VNEPGIVFAWIAGGIALVAAVCDIRTKKLPNWLTVTSFAAGVCYHTLVGALSGSTWYGGAWDGLLFSLGGFALGFFSLLVVWMIGGCGAGDVKLMGALGAWLGAWLTLYVLIGSNVAAIFFSLAMMFSLTLSGGSFRLKTMISKRGSSRRNPKPSLGSSAAAQQTAVRRRTKRRLLPFGVPVAVATWLVLIWKNFVQHA